LKIEKKGHERSQTIVNSFGLSPFRLDDFVLQPKIEMKIEKGFTLVELMSAVTILVIIGGTAYTAFNMALDTYHRDAVRMILLQNVRIALNHVANDLGNVYLVEGDNTLKIFTEDVPEDETISKDVISFVAIVDSQLDPFVFQLSQTSEEYEEEEEDEEGGDVLQSDIKRIFYYLKVPESEEEEEKFELFEIESESVEQTYSLIRATSEKLDLGEEMSLQEVVESGVIPPTTEQELEEGSEGTQLEEVVIADHVTSLDFKYSDGEDWLDYWEEEEENPPKAVQVVITVVDEKGREKPATQSTMIYLTLSANFSEEEAGAPGAGGGGPGGGGGGR